MPDLLFICSKNQWRSPTAQLLFKNHPVYTASSAGTSPKARIRINQKMIDHADMILVMERKHLDLLKQRFSTGGKKLVVPGIEDHYRFNDPELIEILKNSLKDYL